jgi:2,4-dienoyl-CoA reductase-like NADH-dependent reductase (Old Yellow Enzyme family)
MASWVHSDPAHNHVAKTYVSSKEEGGWPDHVHGPSAEPFSDTYPKPKEMSLEDMNYVADAFVAATKRCKAAGCTSSFYDFSWSRLILFS